MPNWHTVVVLGVDACRGGWVGVILEDGRFAGAVGAGTIGEFATQADGVDAIGIDIPIGLADNGPRRCDLEARGVLGSLGTSVFVMPSRPVLDAASYDEANALARDRSGSGISRQCFALFTKVREVEAWLRDVDRLVVREVHPEVSFAAMNSGPLRSRKKTWAGVHERRALLASQGIVLPDDLGAVGLRAGVDDVLDAAAAAWSAQRIADGRAVSLPSPPQLDRDREIAIWA